MRTKLLNSNKQLIQGLKGKQIKSEYVASILENVVYLDFLNLQNVSSTNLTVTYPLNVILFILTKECYMYGLFGRLFKTWYESIGYW